MTMMEVTPEIGSGEEGDYVIDESESYQTGGDYRRGAEYGEEECDDDDDDDEQYDNKPINLSKVVSPKRDDQVGMIFTSAPTQ